jgi:hypothetical protein
MDDPISSGYLDAGDGRRSRDGLSAGMHSGGRGYVGQCILDICQAGTKLGIPLDNGLKMLEDRLRH